MRLNGWQRIGFVLTVIWVIVGGFWFNHRSVDRQGANVIAAHQRCLAELSAQPDGTMPSDTDWGTCDRAFARDWSPAVADHWLDAAIYTFAPIPFAWLILYGFVALGRRMSGEFSSQQ